MSIQGLILRGLSTGNQNQTLITEGFDIGPDIPVTPHTDCQKEPPRINDEAVGVLTFDLVKSPSGVWADYNCLYRQYLWLRQLEPDRLGPYWILCPEDVPSPPVVSQFPDLISEETDNDCC